MKIRILREKEILNNCKNKKEKLQMVKEILHTDFADVKRAKKEDIKYMVNYLQNIPIIQLFIDLVPLP